MLDLQRRARGDRGGDLISHISGLDFSILTLFAIDIYLKSLYFIILLLLFSTFIDFTCFMCWSTVRKYRAIISCASGQSGQENTCSYEAIISSG